MLIRGDARHIPLRDKSIQCVVTSPPYFGLRDYGTAQWVGGDPVCDHFKLAGGIGAQNPGKSAAASLANVERASVPYRDVCGKCGAHRVDKQIGLEPTPDAYVRTLVGVFREVWRVLKDDGVVWLNLGDSYYNCSPVRKSSAGNFEKTFDTTQARTRGGPRRYPDKDDGTGLKMKDLIGIPWRVALAFQADGWYLRSDVIWAKNNPMPESVTDRPTRSHEYLFLFTKSARYYYNAAAIAEPVSDAMLAEVEQGYDGLGLKDYEAAGVQNPSSVKARIIANARTKAREIQARGDRQDGDRQDGDRQALRSVAGQFGAGSLTRNKRSVWTIQPMPYAGAHFATMPEMLVAPCVLAGSRPGDLVLDPFIGSGTVGSVAEQLGRRWVGIDLAYQALARDRTAQRGLFTLPRELEEA